MSKQLKSTIQLDLDPSGVVKGVAATNRELTKLNRSASRTAGMTSITAGIGVIQTAFAAMRGVINAIDQRMQSLNEMAFKFSPEAMGARAQQQIATIQAEQQIGKAIGLGAAATANIERERQERMAARVTANAPDIAAAEAFWGSLKSSFVEVKDAVIDQFLVNLADPSSNRTMTGAALDAAGLPQFLAGEGYSQGYTAGGSARGMPYDTDMIARQTRALESIEQKLGGK